MWFSRGVSLTAGLDLGNPAPAGVRAGGTAAAAETVPQNPAASGSNLKGPGWSSPCHQVSPSSGSSLLGWPSGCSFLRRDVLALWVLPGCRSTHPAALDLFCRRSACFCYPLSSCLLFSPSQNLISQGKAGHEFKEQLLFCSRCLAQTPRELEHLLSGFSSIRFASGLRNWHKSTRDLE